MIAIDLRARSRAIRLWLMTAVLLAGWALRTYSLTANRFHPDEALFATLARLVVSGRDPLLGQTHLLVDKPPLFYYILAGSVALTGGTEFATRLPNLMASILTIALTARLAWTLWRSPSAALTAAVLAALSPFAIQFAPTTFADPQMVMWLMAALAAAGARRWGLAGALGGLALGTKQSALFFLPLVAMVGIIQSARDRTGWRDVWGWGWRFALTFGVAVAAIAIWDVARQGAVSFWSAGVEANNPGRIVRSDEVWPRAGEWLGWLSYLTGIRLLDVAGLSVIAALGPMEIAVGRGTRGAAATLILLAFVVSYAALLWLVAFPLLDRYVLPLVPLLAMLVGRGLTRIAEASRRVRLNRWLITGAAVALIYPAWRAAHGEYPIGGDHGAMDGIDEAADYLARQPWGTVVYYHDLSWVMDYYLFDAYIYQSYVLTPGQLRDDLAAFGRSGIGRYLALAQNESETELLYAAGQAGCHATLVMSPRGRTGEPTIRLYRFECGP